jgi:hypothetical protein
VIRSRPAAASLTLAAFLGAAGCARSAKDVEPAAPARVVAPSLPSFTGAFSDKPALTLILKAVANPQWKTVGAEDVLNYEKDGVEQYAKRVTRFPFHQDGIERLLFLYESAPAEDNQCHACRVTLGAAVFSHQHDAWQLELSAPEMTEHGSWGASVGPGEVTLLRIGRDRFALRKTSCDMHFGRRDCMLELYEIAREFPSVFLLVQSVDNEGVCSDDPADQHDGTEPCETSDSRLSIVPGINVDYDDIVVSTRGVEMDPVAKKVAPFAREQRFTFRDGKYQKAAG